MDQVPCCSAFKAKRCQKPFVIKCHVRHTQATNDLRSLLKSLDFNVLVLEDLLFSENEEDWQLSSKPKYPKSQRPRACCTQLSEAAVSRLRCRQHLQYNCASGDSSRCRTFGVEHWNLGWPRERKNDLNLFDVIVAICSYHAIQFESKIFGTFPNCSGAQKNPGISHLSSTTSLAALEGHQLKKTSQWCQKPVEAVDGTCFCFF